MSGPIFIIKNLTKKFKNGNSEFFALNKINLEIDGPGIVSIVGKSGSGKSTFLNLIAGIEKPTSGHIIFHKKKISKLSDNKFSKYHLNDISLVFQHYNLFNYFTAYENALFPLKMKGMNSLKAKKKVDEMFKRFGMENLINRRVDNLSGGEKQRVAIIRALITEPEVLLCDEPTGALDFKNSKLIMDILEEISKEKLVIIVSHNLDLVDKYSIRIIRFKDGVIESDISRENNKQKFEAKKTKYRYSSNWTRSFLKINLKRNRKKIILSFITFILGFTAVFLAIGFSFGSSESQNRALETNLELTYATVSETSYITIENSPLSFEKNVRPSTKLIDEKIVDFKSIEYSENLSYFFTNNPQGKFDNQDIEGFSMVPLLNISEDNYRSSLLISGGLPNEQLSEVIVNKEFCNLLNIDYKKIIDKVFNISYSTTISVSSGNIDDPLIKDTFSYNMNLTIKGVVNEFSFLNTPKIYYSYSASKKFLQDNYSQVISRDLGQLTSYYDLIVDSSDDNVISSYSSIIFLKSLDEKDRFFTLIKDLDDAKDELKIKSTVYDVQNSYESFIGSFSSALFVFVIIAFVGINLIIGMISLSNFIQNKKESAILTCLGAKNGSIISIYLIENYIILFITLICSIYVSMLGQKYLNQLIYNKFSFVDLISIPFDKFFNIRYGLPLIILIISLITITIFTLVPLLAYRKVSLSDELRDE